jgi:uncharacterized protein YndB with AHSA1/START domain
MMADQEYKPSMSDETVRSRTGKGWSEWFSILDEAGAKEKSHKEIVAVINQNYEVDLWWQQSITVEYEKARGLRDKGQAAEGYQVSASKTFPVDMETLFNAWNDPSLREGWLPDAPMMVNKATPGKSMRISWRDGESRVDVYFTAKGEKKSAVQLQHSKLSDAQEGERMKVYWKEALGRLAEILS